MYIYIYICICIKSVTWPVDHILILLLMITSSFSASPNFSLFMSHYIPDGSCIHVFSGRKLPIHHSYLQSVLVERKKTSVCSPAWSPYLCCFNSSPASRSFPLCRARHLFDYSFHLWEAQLAHQMLASNPQHRIGCKVVPNCSLSW